MMSDSVIKKAKVKRAVGTMPQISGIAATMAQPLPIRDTSRLLFVCAGATNARV